MTEENARDASSSKEMFGKIGKQCLEILHLVNLLSRTNHNNNLKLLLQFKVISYPIQIARLATQKLVSDAQNFGFWWDHLRIVLANCYQIISNFTNPHFYWKQIQLHPSDMDVIPTDLEEIFLVEKSCSNFSF